MSEAISFTASTTAIPSNTLSGPILSPVRTQVQSVTPRPVGSIVSRPYVLGFTMPMNGRKQPNGMPTFMMATLHNNVSTFVEPVANTFSPLQGLGSAVNNLGQNIQPPVGGFSSQLPIFTNNYLAVIRQQMDKSNHEMVNMLTQHMGAIFNPLI